MCNANVTSGFTLIELLVVVIIIGVLASISLPSLMRMVARAKEVEAKNNLSAIAFAQQGYRFEYRSFATSYADLGLQPSGKYYDYFEPEAVPQGIISNAQPKSWGEGNARFYSMGVYVNNEAFILFLCESKDELTTTKAPESFDGACAEEGKRL
ncbi:prepilin-type N-terminal cleavage/methylation domain-containing protein [Synechocystis sp. B12]|nr:prepilin-type N-terminal cleavage/methylation domain-containing protein [Synechocystis sp. B12]